MLLEVWILIGIFKCVVICVVIDLFVVVVMIICCFFVCVVCVNVMIFLFIGKLFIDSFVVFFRLCFRMGCFLNNYRKIRNRLNGFCFKKVRNVLYSVLVCSSVWLRFNIRGIFFLVVFGVELFEFVVVWELVIDLFIFIVVIF